MSNLSKKLVNKDGSPINYYGVKAFYNSLLTKDTPILPVNNKISLTQVELKFLVLAGDRIEVNSAISASYDVYASIGDTYTISYTLDGSALTPTSAITGIVGENSTSVIAHGNLFTHIEIAKSAELILTMDITTLNNITKTFSANSTGMQARVLRKIS